VILEWATASEIDTIGFNIYRRRILDGTMNQVNSLMIQAVSTGAVEGATYQFRVTGLKPGKFYYFWLEDVDIEQQLLHSTDRPYLWILPPDPPFKPSCMPGG